MVKLEVEKVPASHGWLWVKHGYRLIMRNPLQAFSLAMMFVLGLFVAMLVPLVGVLLTILLMPVLLAGYMRVCRALEFNEAVQPRYIFSGFENRAAQLVAVGGMLLLGMMIISIVITALGGPELKAILSSYQTQQDPTAFIDSLLAPASGLRLVLLSAFALFFLLMLALQFAPMLVFFNQMTPLQALKVSLLASIRNILPFAVYSLIMQLIAFVLSVIPLGLGLIILLPLGLTSMYVAYRDIFSETQIPETDKAAE